MFEVEKVGDDEIEVTNKNVTLNFLRQQIQKAEGQANLSLADFVLDRQPTTDNLPAKPTHIAVMRLSAMGDVAMTVPVLRALVNEYPQVKITVISRPFFQPFFRAFILIPLLRMFTIHAVQA